MKLETVKNFLRTFSKKRRYTIRFDSQNVKASQMLGKSPCELFYHVFLSLSWKLIWKMSPLVLGEILRVFVKTLTADDKYPLEDCENLQLPIQMQLSGKQTTFAEFFVPFLESTPNFKFFERKANRHSECISEIRDWKTCLGHSLKSAVSEHALTANMWKRLEYLLNPRESAFIMFFIILMEVYLEFVSPSFSWNLRGVL